MNDKPSTPETTDSKATDLTQSPPDDAPATDGQVKRRASGVARSALFFALLGLLLVLAAGGAGGWYLWQDYQARPGHEQRLQRIERELSAKPSRDDLARVGEQPQRRGVG